MLVAALLLGGCNRSGDEVVEPPADPTPPGSVWLRAGCDLPERVERERQRLTAQGAVEIAGGQPYRWQFECRGETLWIDIERAASTADREPVLWAGALAEPPSVVTIVLDVGDGQEQLERWLADPAWEDPLRVTVDPGTGVVTKR